MTREKCSRFPSCTLQPRRMLGWDCIHGSTPLGFAIFEHPFRCQYVLYMQLATKKTAILSWLQQACCILVTFLISLDESQPGHAGVFWFNRPWLLLPVIKYLVFFNTFVFANSIFFASQFGTRSCFFSKTGFQGAVPISWWVRSSSSPLDLDTTGQNKGWSETNTCGLMLQSSSEIQAGAFFFHDPTAAKGLHKAGTPERRW